MVTNLVDNHDDGRLYIIYLGLDATERPDAVLFGRGVRSRIGCTVRVGYAKSNSGVKTFAGLGCAT